MTVAAPLEQMARLCGSAAALQTLFAQEAFGIAATRVVVASPQRELAEALVTAVSDAAKGTLPSARIVLHAAKAGYPDLAREAQPIDGLWVVCGIDKDEFKGRDFVQWADAQRETLARLPIHGFTIIRTKTLPHWHEPIAIDRVAAAGRSVLVSPLLLGNHPPQLDGSPMLKALQLQVVTRLLLDAVAHATGYRSFAATAQAWDRTAAKLLDRRMTSPRRNAGGGVGPALLQFGELRELLESARMAARSVGAAMAAAGALDASYAAAEAIETLVAKAAVWMNQGRDRGRQQAAQAVPTDPFASDFQRLRDAGLQFAADLSVELAKRGRPKQALTIDHARGELLSDIKVVVLGPFSSGKSTFLNSLLGLNEENNPLPTGAAPETTTITELMHTTQADEVVVQFAEVVTLELFETPERPERWTINKMEIRALLTWLREKAVDRSKIRILRFGASRSEKEQPWSRTDEKFFSSLVDPANKDTHYDESRLKKERAIHTVANIGFLLRPSLPERRDIGKTLQWVKLPEHALQIDRVVVSRNLAPLQGLTFVDTPGTDSMFSHHHTLARKYIEEFKTSPVICLFDAKTPGSEEDARNVAFLKKINADSSRLFFVITKRGDATKDEREVRDTVDLRLRDAGLPTKRAYYIDSIEARTNPSDLEWRSLVAALRRYVNVNRTALLQQRMRLMLRTQLQAMAAAERTSLDGLRRGSAGRQDEAAAWKAAAQEIAAVLKWFETSIDGAKERLFRRSATSLETFQADVTDIDAQLEGFDCGAFWKSTKANKLRDVVAIVDRLDEWPQRLKTNLITAARLLHGALSEELHRHAPSMKASLTLAELPPDFHVLQLTEIREEAKKDTSWLFRYTPWLETKVERLRALIKTERTNTIRAVNAAFAGMAKSYRAQCRALQEQAEDFANAAEREDDGGAEAKKTKELLAFLEHSLREYDALDPALVTIAETGDGERETTPEEDGYVGDGNKSRSSRA